MAVVRAIIIHCAKKLAIGKNLLFINVSFALMMHAYEHTYIKKVNY